MLMILSIRKKEEGKEGGREKEVVGARGNKKRDEKMFLEWLFGALCCCIAVT